MSKLSWRRYWAYSQYVWNHKVAVYKAGRLLGLPRLRLLLHDISKFYPDEFFAYAATFYTSEGDKKEYQVPESPDFLEAWALHQKRNSHHWQYYLYLNKERRVPLRLVPAMLVMDRGDLLMVDGVSVGLKYRDGDFLENKGLIADPMDIDDALEMLADWLSFGGREKTRDWYLKTRDQKILHPETKAFIEGMLGV